MGVLSKRLMKRISHPRYKPPLFTLQASYQYYITLMRRPSFQVSYLKHYYIGNTRRNKFFFPLKKKKRAIHFINKSQMALTFFSLEYVRCDLHVAFIWNYVIWYFSQENIQKRLFIHLVKNRCFHVLRKRTRNGNLTIDFDNKY